QLIADRGVAVWDVLMSCHRPGSLDSAIDPASAVPNDFPAFFDAYPSIETLLFNGKAAYRLYHRFFADETMKKIALPSTSPAYAAMRHAEKQKIWLKALS
ncbi:MAG: DNA-deoxyinosine glycosylase, partial [Pseudomonadota bacterium]